MFRDMFAKKGAKNDKYYGITLHPEGKSFVPEMDKKFIDFYAKESPKRLILHKTYTKQVAGGDNTKDNGDLTDPKTMRLFGGQITSKCDFITADGGFENLNENLQEQEAFRLILAEIINAAKIQKKGGNFVCKFFETFTNTSMKMVCILNELYDNVQFVKPLSSRISNSEKYAVCFGFNFGENDKAYKGIMASLEGMLEIMHKEGDKFVVGVFGEYIVPRDTIKAVTGMNVMLSNLQMKSVNNIVSFINKEIYSGDEYYTSWEEQKDGSKYWIELFYPEKSEEKKAKEKRDKLISTILKITKGRAERVGVAASMVE